MGASFGLDGFARSPVGFEGHNTQEHCRPDSFHRFDARWADG